MHLVVGDGLEAYLPLSDMVDISSEMQRLSKRLSKMQLEYSALLSRLNSPKVCLQLRVFFNFLGEVDNLIDKQINK